MGPDSRTPHLVQSRLFDRIVHFPDRGEWYTASIAFQAVLAVFMLTLVPKVGRRFGWGYAVYVLAVLAIPFVGSKDFQGIGRYGLAAFPVFALLGSWLAEHPARAKVFLGVSAAVLAVLTCGFARGAYVS